MSNFVGILSGLSYSIVALKGSPPKRLPTLHVDLVLRSYLLRGMPTTIHAADTKYLLN